MWTWSLNPCHTAGTKHTCNSLVLLLLHPADIHLQALDHNAHALEMLGCLIVLVRWVEQSLGDGHILDICIQYFPWGAIRCKQSKLRCIPSKECSPHSSRFHQGSLCVRRKSGRSHKLQSAGKELLSFRKVAKHNDSEVHMNPMLSLWRDTAQYIHALTVFMPNWAALMAAT